MNKRLIKACKQGKLEIVKFLVELKADITAEDNWAVQSASSNGHMETVKFLIENKADITALNNNWVVQSASSKGCLETVKFLVENKADITADGNRAVWWASQNGHMGTVKFLLSKGADFNMLTSKHKTYFLTLKWFRRWRFIIFLRRLTQVALPLYYSPGFPGWLKGKKCLEDFESEMKREKI